MCVQVLCSRLLHRSGPSGGDHGQYRLWKAGGHKLCCSGTAGVGSAADRRFGFSHAPTDQTDRAHLTPSPRPPPQPLFHIPRFSSRCLRSFLGFLWLQADGCVNAALSAWAQNKHRCWTSLSSLGWYRCRRVCFSSSCSFLTTYAKGDWPLAVQLLPLSPHSCRRLQASASSNESVKMFIIPLLSSCFFKN